MSDFSWVYHFSWAILAPCLIILVTGYIFLKYWRSLDSRANSVKSQLQAVSRKLSAISPDNMVTEFAKFEEIFLQEAPDLSHCWQKFNESLIKKPGEVYNTLDVEYFFDPQSIVETSLATDFVKHLPGIFTAIGIIGTFVSIAFGLQSSLKEMQSLTPESLNHATQTLLQHVWPGFAASCTAVVGAVFFLWKERKCIQELAGQTRSLQKNLDRLFPRRTGEQYLHWILDETKQHTSSLKDFSTDLADSVKSSLQMLVLQQTQELQRSNETLVEKIGVSVAEQLTPVSEHLREAVAEMKREQSTSAQETIRELVGQFSNSLAGSAQGQLRDMASTITGTSELLAQTKSEMEGFLTRLSLQIQEQQQEQASRIQEVLNIFSESAAVGSEKITRTQGEAMDRLVQLLVGTQKEMEQRLEQLANSVAESTGTNLRNMTDAVTSVATDLRDTTQKLLSEVQQTTGSNLETLHERFSQTMRQNHSEMSSLLSERLLPRW